MSKKPKNARVKWRVKWKSVKEVGREQHEKAGG
jgi:hypothetical protein